MTIDDGGVAAVYFWLAPGEPPVKKTASSMGFPGGAWGGPLHLARQAFKRNGQNGSTMHREMK